MPGENIKDNKNSGFNMALPEQQNVLQLALNRARSSLVAAMGFSMVINVLMLVPALYMLQLYARVLPTGNFSTLIKLRLL